LSEAISKYQFSLERKYGGINVILEQEWNEITEKSETVKLQIAPNSQIFVSQYQQGFGKEKNLFSSKLEIIEDSGPLVESQN